MKKILLTSIILILVPTLIFLPAYIFLIHTTAANAKDYSEDIQGQWEAIQYYHENERVACKDGIWITITFEGNRIKIDGTVLEKTEAEFTWEGGTALSFEAQGEKVMYLLSFDNNGNLKIVIDNTPYIIILRSSGG